MLLPQYKDDDVLYTRGSRHHKSWLACDTCPPVINAELINPGYISQSAYHCLCLSLLVLIVWLANHSACLILVKKLLLCWFLESQPLTTSQKIGLLFICAPILYYCARTDLSCIDLPRNRIYSKYYSIPNRKSFGFFKHMIFAIYMLLARYTLCLGI